MANNAMNIQKLWGKNVGIKYKSNLKKKRKNENYGQG